MEFVNGKDDIPYMTWKIKFMFETTNQIAYKYLQEEIDLCPSPFIYNKRLTCIEILQYPCKVYPGNVLKSSVLAGSIGSPSWYWAGHPTKAVSLIEYTHNFMFELVSLSVITRKITSH